MVVGITELLPLEFVIVVSRIIGTIVVVLLLAGIKTSSELPDTDEISGVEGAKTMPELLDTDGISGVEEETRTIAELLDTYGTSGVEIELEFDCIWTDDVLLILGLWDIELSVVVLKVDKSEPYVLMTPLPQVQLV
jgi:hypothetical protein